MGFVLAFSLLGRAALLMLVGVLPVRVTLNSGDTQRGELVKIADSTVVVQSKSGPAELAFDDVLSLAPVKTDEATGPTSRVELAGGTRIAAQDFLLSGEVLTVEPRRQGALQIPVRQVKSIRFRGSSPVTDPQWLGLMGKPQRRDLLVIRRDGDRLDPTEGIIESVSKGKVRFNLDGESVDAPTARLEGVVFAGASTDPSSSSIQVYDRYGSKWLASSIETSDDLESLELEFGDSLSHTIALAHLESIRFSSGLTMLATQRPAGSTYQPYLASNVDGQLMRDWFGPSNKGESDLIMIGDSSIEYRLDEGFQTLAGAVRRDEDVTQAGMVSVNILLDREQVWSENITGAETLGFELPAEGSRRLRIEVDSGDDGDVGDRVIVVRPRLLK